MSSNSSPIGRWLEATEITVTRKPQPSNHFLKEENAIQTSHNSLNSNKDADGISCHTPLNERIADKDIGPFVIQPNGSVWVRREVIFKAMEEAGFVRRHSCCDAELKKMCENDQYEGNLEGFVNRLMKLIGVSPIPQDNP